MTSFVTTYSDPPGDQFVHAGPVVPDRACLLGVLAHPPTGASIRACVGLAHLLDEAVLMRDSFLIQPGPEPLTLVRQHPWGRGRSEYLFGEVIQIDGFAAVVNVERELLGGVPQVLYGWLGEMMGGVTRGDARGGQFVDVGPE